MAKMKRKSISLETKYKVIQLVDKNVSNKEILDQFKSELNDSTNISKIKRKREDIIKTFESTTTSNLKRMRPSKYPEIDKALVQFISNCSTNGVPINGTILKEKATKYANEFGYNDFKASNGYFQLFKKRNLVLFQTFHGEANSVSDDTCSEWIDIKLPQIIKDYDPKDIFNADEFGLFWRLFPSKSYNLKGKTFKSGNSSKIRISVLICANMDGSEKLNPLVIGRSKNPRAFRGKKSLPVKYRFNSTSWMTGDIFEEFAQTLNKNMVKNSRKVLLFVDNCPSHQMIILSNVKIVFLPKNTTSRLQPLDQGVIKCLKGYYRLSLARKLVSMIDSNI